MNTITEFKPPVLMGIGELAAYQRHYEVRLRDHLNGRGPGLSETEKGHAYAVEHEYRKWKAALAHSYSR